MYFTEALSYVRDQSITYDTGHNNNKGLIIFLVTFLLFMHSPHTFDIQSTKPQTFVMVAAEQQQTRITFPILKGMVRTLYVEEGGIREPHWHPNAAELDYVAKGRARMTIFSHGGTLIHLKLGLTNSLYSYCLLSLHRKYW